MLFAYRDATLHEGYVEGPRHRRRGVAAAVRPRRRQRARHGAGRLERRAARPERTTARRCRASTAASRCARGSTRTCTRAPRPTARSTRRARCCARPRSATSTATWSRRSSTPAGEHVYAWNADGSAVPGFPVRLDPALSRPQDRTRNNHIKRGFTASPALGDLNEDGDARHRGRRRSTSTSTPGTAAATRCRASRRSCATRASRGAEIITTRGARRHHRRRQARHRHAHAGVRRQPVRARRPRAAARPAASRNFLTNVLANVLGGSGRVYALDRNGNMLPGWPTAPNGIVPDALPFVGPGVDHVLANVDSDPRARGDRQRRQRRRDRHQRRRLERGARTTPSRRAASTSTRRR